MHFDLLFVSAATATVQLLTFWKFAKKWFDYERRPFYLLLFWLRIDGQLVTDQSPFSYNQSPIIHRLVDDRSQQIASISPYVRLTVANWSPINCWQVAIPIGDHKLIPDIGIMVSAIASQLQWNQSRTVRIAVTTYVWLMLKQQTQNFLSFSAWP